ncbi:hypothetical protein OG920_05105 [Streptomyces europaeiscabiei]|uniref:hypothetical protein n=1 Tax=Streptomyces europaeiscabiei TaxID=146819 RepID=UPI0029A26099|nr:hypothetical protein [Streptomyces europaeiscabiei]MDX3611352.1 hypothetical protein [Streptomyces europaeiscabiei]
MALTTTGRPELGQLSSSSISIPAFLRDRAPRRSARPRSPHLAQAGVAEAGGRGSRTGSPEGARESMALPGTLTASLSL